MKFEKFDLARKYARIFLRLFYPEPKSSPLKAYQNLLSFFKQHPGVIGLVANCPCPQQCYSQLEEFLIKKFKLTSLEQKLFHRLLLDHKIILLPDILYHLIDLEHARSNELVCTIETSHKLSPEWERKLVKIFETMTNKKIIPKILVEPKLICGLQMYSSTIMYEHSVEKSLRTAEIITKTKGGLW